MLFYENFFIKVAEISEKCIENNVWLVYILVTRMLYLWINQNLFI